MSLRRCDVVVGALSSFEEDGVAPDAVVLTAIAAQIRALEVDIADLFRVHPDAPIFLSLPRTRVLRGARLLGDIGDCRARFPTPESLASLAGVTP